jgi:dolichol-phosphate mannosyltransferase
MLAELTSRRAARFATVGTSGVAVNLGALWLLAETLGVEPNVASAAAIGLSMTTNFALNDLWTFRDRRDAVPSRRHRALRFYAVSLVGAGVQWSVFVGLRALVTRFQAAGVWLLLAQCCGIGAATCWNFLVNLGWTWRAGAAEQP